MNSKIDKLYIYTKFTHESNKNNGSAPPEPVQKGDDIRAALEKRFDLTQI